MSDERQAYTPADAIYTKTDKRRALARQNNTRTQTRLGILLIGLGLIWATYAARADYAGLLQLRVLPPGPLEVCAIGILIWLHGKWRRSLQPK